MVTQAKVEKIEEVKIDLKRTYTVEEFERLEDDGNHYELIEGKLVMTPATGYEHGSITNILSDAIREFLKKNKGIGDSWTNMGFYIGKKPNGKDNVPEPDLGFIIASRIPLVSDIYLPYPDLAVEVWSRKSDLASKGSIKRAREKLQMFLDTGTRLAWGINPKEQTVEVYHKGQIEPVAILSLDDMLDGEDVIPGFSLEIKKLFE